MTVSELLNELQKLVDNNNDDLIVKYNDNIIGFADIDLVLINKLAEEDTFIQLF